MCVREGERNVFLLFLVGKKKVGFLSQNIHPPKFSSIFFIKENCNVGDEEWGGKRSRIEEGERG